MINPAAKDLVSTMDEDNIDKWITVDDDTPAVHYCTDLKIVEMVASSE